MWSEVCPRVPIPVYILCASTNFIQGIDLHQYLRPTGSQDRFSEHPQMRILGCITCRYRAISYIYILQFSVSHALKPHACSRSLFFSSCPSAVTRPLTLPLIRTQNRSIFLPTPPHYSDFCQLSLPSHLPFLVELISLSSGPYSKKSKLYCWCHVVNYKHSYFLDNICLSPVYTTGVAGNNSPKKTWFANQK